MTPKPKLGHLGMSDNFKQSQNKNRSIISKKNQQGQSKNLPTKDTNIKTQQIGLKEQK